MKSLLTITFLYLFCPALTSQWKLEHSYDSGGYANIRTLDNDYYFCDGSDGILTMTDQDHDKVLGLEFPECEYLYVIDIKNNHWDKEEGLELLCACDDGRFYPRYYIIDELGNKLWTRYNSRIGSYDDEHIVANIGGDNYQVIDNKSLEILHEVPSQYLRKKKSEAGKTYYLNTSPSGSLYLLNAEFETVNELQLNIPSNYTIQPTSNDVMIYDDIDELRLVYLVRYTIFSLFGSRNIMEVYDEAGQLLLSNINPLWNCGKDKGLFDILFYTITKTNLPELTVGPSVTVPQDASFQIDCEDPHLLTVMDSDNETNYYYDSNLDLARTLEHGIPKSDYRILSHFFDREDDFHWWTSSIDNLTEVSTVNLNYPNGNTQSFEDKTDLTYWNQEGFDPLLLVSHFDKDKVDIYKQKTVSVKENNSNQFSIFPNPVRTTLTIINQEESPWVLLELMDSKGQLIHKQDLDAHLTKTQLPIENYPDGVYYVKVHFRNGIATNKVIKY